jgi:phenylacetate-coenzyme A ligase PaaK-like adenylate-forming protein
MIRPRPADGEPGGAPLLVRVERGSGASADDAQVAARCAAAIREHLGIDAHVEVLARDTIPRSGYKAARVVDD